MEQQLILFGFVWSDSVVKAVDALPGCMLGAIGKITPLLSFKEGDPSKSTQSVVPPISAVLLARVSVKKSQQV